MKPVVTFLVWLLGTSVLWSQGTLEMFTCSIRGNEFVGNLTNPVSGSGTLFLRNNELGYSITVPNLRNLPAEAHFHADGTDLRASLANYVFLPPNGSWPGGIVFEGSMTVTDFRDSLVSGNWYAQIHSPNYENGVMRGYVIPVPEPGALALLAVGLWALTRRLRASVPRAGGSRWRVRIT